MNRTTILLDDQLGKRLKEKAAKEGKTATELIRTYVRSGLNRPVPLHKRGPVSLPSFSMGEPTVDPADRSRLWDLMDEK